MVSFLNKITSFNHLSIAIFNIGIKPLVLSYERKKRVYGKSKWTLKKKVILFVDVLIAYTTFPIRFFILFGFLLACASFLLFIYLFVNYFLNGSNVPGFYTLASLISLIGGFLLILVGLLGEYLLRIYIIMSKINDPFVEDDS